MLRYICSLPNRGTKGTPHELFYADDAAGRARAAAFIEHENRPGRGVYYCIGRLKDGATARGKDTVAELDEVVVDLDLKDIVQSRDKVIACLTGLILPPHEIRDSGFGLHASWRLKEPVIDEAGLAQAEGIMKQLAELLAGDQAPTHRAALLRQPDTNNTKELEPRRCHTVWQGGSECDISEFEDLFDLYGDRPLLTRKEMPRANGHDTEAGDPGPDTKDFRMIDGKFDVDAWFATMPPTGAAANEFQPKALTALLWEATHPEDCIQAVVDATMKAAESLDWNRDTEFKKVTARCVSSVGRLNKMYDPATGAIPGWLAGEFHAAWVAALAQGKRPQLSRNAARWHVRAYSTAEEQKPEQEANDKAERKNNKKETEGETGDRRRAKPEKGKLRAVPFQAFDESKLERRAHLYAKHYQRGQATATIGPGGAGKSSLDLVEAIAMCTCRDLLGEQPTERCRVWIHNGDDDTKEMKRRIAAVCRHYDFAMTDLEGWLFVTSKSDFSIKVAGGNGVLVIDHKTIQDIIRTIAENQIDVVIFEPLVTLHGVSENDNVKMNAVIHIFGEIADGCDCAVELCHHTRKLLAGVEEYSSDDGRGATAIRDAVRCSRVLNPISREEARKAGIDEQERAFYFRVDGGKANYLPPSARATWRKFENVRLLNDDNVGVVTAWEFQAAQSALSDEDCEKIQAEVQKGDYREHKQRSPERWVGRVVAKHLGLNPNEEANDWKIKRGIRDLENKGVIAYDTHRLVDDHRPTSYAIPGPWKKPAST
jgi:RecA-family ATPase